MLGKKNKQEESRGHHRSNQSLRMPLIKPAKASPCCYHRGKVALWLRIKFTTLLFFSTLIPLCLLSSQWGSSLPNFQSDSSYQQCPILMIYVTAWLCFCGNVLLPHKLEIVGKMKVFHGGHRKRWSQAAFCLCLVGSLTAGIFLILIPRGCVEN